MSEEETTIMTNEDAQATLGAIQDHEFDQAVALLVSFYMEGSDDSRLPELFGTLRGLYPRQFEKVLVLANAIKDPLFDQYGLADPAPILRDFETTAGVAADTERFLNLMQEADAAVEKEALMKAAEELNPYRRAAIRLLTKFRHPNIEQVEYELKRL